MSMDIPWQPWITIRGAAATTVDQPTPHCFDLGNNADIIVRVETKTMNNGTLNIETAPTISGPWTSQQSYGQPDSKAALILTNEPNATEVAQRYIRWSVTGSAANWTATFQISIKSRNSTNLRSSNQNRQESCEIQPWVTLVGNTSMTGDNIIVPLESYWIDTEGMDKLQIEVETIDLDTANLKLERAMSPEGPWTNLTTITATGVTTVTLDSSSPMSRYIRWHLDASSSPWTACFRINARGWP